MVFGRLKCISIFSAACSNTIEPCAPHFNNRKRGLERVKCYLYPGLPRQFPQRLFHKYHRSVFLNSLNFRAHLIFAQMVARNNYFFAHFTARKLNVLEIYLLKRGAKTRLRETGKRVKHIFLP